MLKVKKLAIKKKKAKFKIGDRVRLMERFKNEDSLALHYLGYFFDYIA